MLSNEIMGVLALGIVWVNTLLVVGAAWRRARAIAARRSLMRALEPDAVGVGLVEGTVAEAETDLARLELHQVGRQASDDAGRAAIAFSDRVARGEVLGGALVTGGHRVAVSPQTGATAEVWLDERAVTDAAGCPSDAVFDAAYAEARKAKGYARTIEARVAPGARVWVFGEVRRAPDGARRVHPLPDLPLIVSTVDPRVWCRDKLRLIHAAVVGLLVAAGACTAVALVRPHFGLVSMLGGALCLAFFLLVQPAGTALRDGVLFPHQRIVRGHWLRGRAAARTSSSAADAVS